MAYSRLSLSFGKDKFPALSGVNTDILQSLLTGTDQQAQGNSRRSEIAPLYISDDRNAWSDWTTPVGRDAAIRRRLLDRSSWHGAGAAGLLRSDFLCHLLWSIQVLVLWYKPSLNVY
jgi:hypothetical protein